MDVPRRQPFLCFFFSGSIKSWHEKKTDVEEPNQKHETTCNMKNRKLIRYHVLFWQLEINMLHGLVMITVRSAPGRFYVRT